MSVIERNIEEMKEELKQRFVTTAQINYGRELSGLDELVPVCGERQTLLERQERPWGVLCDILSHGVLSLLMNWLGNLHHTKDCDAFVAFCARDDP